MLLPKGEQNTYRNTQFLRCTAVFCKVGFPQERRRAFHVRRRHSSMYDVIVVGARCAGSPTAMLLARKGYRVLLVDKATFPSDTMNGHALHARGGACLKRWGILD